MILRKLLGDVSNILIVGHRNADPDAFCAMLAFEHLFHEINPAGTVTFACEDVSKLSVQVVKTFTESPEVFETVNGSFDFTVMIDTNNRIQLGLALQDVLKSPFNTLVIDHHEPNPEIDQIAKHTIVESDKSSTCEILVHLFRNEQIPLTPLVANLLLTGILFDTRRFFYADVSTLKTALELIDAGADYSRCLQALIVQPDRSERIARLKAAGRLKLHLIDNWIIVTSTVSAFEASACRALLDLGADVAIVGGRPSKGVVRISSRSTQEFYNSTGINLGRDVMEPLGSIIDGEGGGHPNAAGANGTKNRDQALKKAVELIRAAIARKTGGTSIFS